MGTRKYKLTQPELKRQRLRLERFARYLPMLKLKQQQIQLRRIELQLALETAAEAQRDVEGRLETWSALLDEPAGIDLTALALPATVRTSTVNVAGVALPVLGEIEFQEVSYSLFGTPAWSDRALEDLREATRRRLAVLYLAEQERLLSAEMKKVVQRVNLFEKVLLPGAREAIRVIRIKLGDDMAAAVGRAKIAKTKLVDIGRSIHVRSGDSPADPVSGSPS